MDGKNEGFSTEIAKHASLSSSGYNSVVSEILERAKEKLPRSEAAHHLRQRAAVHRM